MRVAIALLSVVFVAADWPQFLGPGRDSTTPDKIAPWKAPPKVLWEQPVGEAHSSPVIANGIVYCFYREKGVDDDHDLEALAAFDAKDGTKKWVKKHERPKFGTLFGAGPQGTPTVASGFIFTYGNTGHLLARNADTGELFWSVDTLKEFKAPNLKFGIATSPTVIGNAVIVMVGGQDAGIVAFDVSNGKPLWKTTGDPASYSTPYIYNKENDLAFLTGTHLRGLAKDGKPLWEYPFQDKFNESSTMPVVHEKMLIASSISRGTVALKLNEKSAEKIWQNESLTCFFSTPVIIGKHLYMINGVTGAKALLDAQVNLRCVELDTGKLLWEKPKVGGYHAALVRTGDDKLLMLDDKGYLTLFESNPKAYTELACTKVCGNTWAHHAVVDGKIYLRDNKKLYCLQP